MPNNSRRQRTDSTNNLHRILAGANVEIAPPAHIPMDDADFPYWHSIVEEKARADWTQHELDCAAFLARSMANFEKQQRLAFVEGPVLERSNGSSGPNPRNGVVKSLSGQVLALRRSLGLTGRANAGSTRDAAHQREANRAAERAARGGHDLLA